MLSKTNDNNNRKCNSRPKPNCQLNGECLTQSLVYKTTSATSSNTGKYKTQYNNHAKSCRHREYMSETELSKHVWNLKDLGLDNNLLWEIHKKGLHTNANVAIYVCRKKCPLFHADADTLLNKRTELISKCRHRNKFLMVNLRK